jgi:hypothetical protein
MQRGAQENLWPKLFSRAPRCAPLRLPFPVADAVPFRKALKLQSSPDSPPRRNCHPLARFTLTGNRAPRTGHSKLHPNKTIASDWRVFHRRLALVLGCWFQPDSEIVFSSDAPLPESVVLPGSFEACFNSSATLLRNRHTNMNFCDL